MLRNLEVMMAQEATTEFWIAIDRALIALLQKDLLPINYKRAFSDVVPGLPQGYSKKTMPVEKFRQRYAEHDHPTIRHIQGGNLVLSSWFPFQQGQAKMFPAALNRPCFIKGNCLLSFDAGAELMLRWPYMKDWFGDAQTIIGMPRYERRKIATLAEKIVKDYFKHKYSEFYRPPRNESQYRRGAPEDFFLEVPTFANPLAVDIKTPSYKDEGGYQVITARNPHAKYIYLIAEWMGEDMVKICGMISGGWIKAVGALSDSGLYHFPECYLTSVEALFVALNMARAGLSYPDYHHYLRERQ